jgi:quinoprotein glucose dehydrogenase
LKFYNKFIKNSTFISIAVTCVILWIVYSETKAKEKFSVERQWSEYLGGNDRNHFSSLKSINRENVHELALSWSYSTNDSGQMQTNPIVIDDMLFGVSPTLQAFSLNAFTGEEIWTFSDTTQKAAHASRGISYWSDGIEKRIFHTIGPNLYALDALTGKLIPSFGIGGMIKLTTGLPEEAQNKLVISCTPGTVFNDLIIMPVRVSEDMGAAPGDVRAFSVKTGKLVWSFHTIPHPGEFGYETFPHDAYKNVHVGGANNWAGMTLDTDREILFVPTGSASYDFYGSQRKGENLFANCLVALNARTGERIWHFQTIHHDLWDRDLPAPPNLITVNHGGKEIDAVAQVTKHGYVFLFERETGKPLFPIDEIPVGTDALGGEHPWPTQPIPTKPLPFARHAHTLTVDDINPFSPDREALQKQFQTLKRDFFAPPSKEGTLILPGFDGGAEWGGAAADPAKGILYVNSNEMPWILTMIDTPSLAEQSNLSPGQQVYTTHCSACHRSDQTGNPKSGYPSLKQIGSRMSPQQIATLINSGKGMMPAFPQLSKHEKELILNYLLGQEKLELAENHPSKSAITLPYKSTGYNKFLDANGLPAIGPPWGTLNAIDMNTGEYLWKIPLGNVDSLAQKNGSPTGIENYGGPAITASGLLFIAATKDEKFRVFDRKNGKLLWETKLPAAAFATPTIYESKGKQFVVIACGGTKLGTQKGNQYLAFALP